MNALEHDVQHLRMTRQEPIHLPVCPVCGLPGLHSVVDACLVALAREIQKERAK